MNKQVDIQSMKIELIQWLTNISDKETLNKILAIKSKEKPLELTPEQERELDSRLSKYLRGEMKFKSWEETKESIKRRAKHAV